MWCSHLARRHPGCRKVRMTGRVHNCGICGLEHLRDLNESNRVAHFRLNWSLMDQCYTRQCFHRERERESSVRRKHQRLFVCVTRFFTNSQFNSNIRPDVATPCTSIRGRTSMETVVFCFHVCVCVCVHKHDNSLFRVIKLPVISPQQRQRLCTLWSMSV